MRACYVCYAEQLECPHCLEGHLKWFGFKITKTQFWKCMSCHTIFFHRP